MAFERNYSEAAPTREQVDGMAGTVVLEFGTAWCGHCQVASPLVEAALGSDPAITHVRIEDGRGHPLGRSFHVKLWPTLVMMRDGHEVARVVRPTQGKDLDEALCLLRQPPTDTPVLSR